MAREPEGYSEILTHILQQYGPLLSVAEVSAYTGVSRRRTTEKFYGWHGTGHGKKLPAAKLARQLCQ